MRVGELADKQATAEKLRAHVLERSKLFLYEVKRESIKHDGRWLEKNLQVKVVTIINLRRSLRGQGLSHTEKKSAAISKEKGSGWTLFVTAGSSDTFQISAALCSLLLDRPNQSSYMTLESFLNLSLYQLRARGYNVERILRAKAAEQRVAEEERKKQMAAEQEHIREQEAQWQQQGQKTPVAAAARAEKQPMPMPGAFGSDSPEASPRAISPRRGKSSSIFSNFTKKLGLNGSSSSGGNDVQEQLQNFLGGSSSQNQIQDTPENPPTYDESNKKGTSSGTEKVSSPAAVSQNLHNAIQSSRAYDSSTLFSPPTTQTVKEQSTYCDSTPSQNITFLASASTGTRIFVSKTLSTAPATFLSQNVNALNTFALLLQDVCDSYALPRKAMHIFYDEAGGTIAFNSSGSVFCNFRFYEQLHARKMEGGEGKTEAVAYWWIVVAHELAHNLVKEHNAEHSFYTYVLIPFSIRGWMES